jgi:hypothetical protein
MGNWGIYPYCFERTAAHSFCALYRLVHEILCFYSIGEGFLLRTTGRRERRDASGPRLYEEQSQQGCEQQQTKQDP